MLVDAHGHVGRLGERAYLPSALDAYLRACGVGHLLISNLDGAAEGPGALDADETDANVACLRISQKDRRLVPLYWVRPGRIDSHVHALAGALQSEPFAGAVFAPRLNGFAADAAILDAYLAVLARRGAVAFFLTHRDDPARPARVYTLAKRHPSVSFVLLDAATDSHWSEALDAVRRARQRQDARLYLETAHAPAGDVVTAVAALGAESILYGSDATVHGEEHAARSRMLLNELRTKLPPESFAKITGTNARALFDLSSACAAPGVE